MNSLSQHKKNVKLDLLTICNQIIEASTNILKQKLREKIQLFLYNIANFVIMTMLS